MLGTLHKRAPPVVENPRKRETLSLAVSRTFCRSADGPVLLLFSSIMPLTSRKTIIKNPLNLLIFNDTFKRFNFCKRFNFALLCNLCLIFALQVEVRCSECKSFDWLNVDLDLILQRINLCKVSVARYFVVKK